MNLAIVGTPHKWNQAVFVCTYCILGCIFKVDLVRHMSLWSPYNPGMVTHPWHLSVSVAISSPLSLRGSWECSSDWGLQGWTEAPNKVQRWPGMGMAKNLCHDASLNWVWWAEQLSPVGTRIDSLIAEAGEGCVSPPWTKNKTTNTTLSSSQKLGRFREEEPQLRASEAGPLCWGHSSTFLLGLRRPGETGDLPRLVGLS